MSKLLIELKDISYKKNGNLILKNINLKINAGEKIALIGKSGAGKTTLISILNKTLRPSNGSIKFFNNPKNNRNHVIGTIWQDLRLINELTAEQNVNCGLLGKKSFFFALKNLLNISSFNRAHYCMNLCKIKPSIYSSKLTEISGGQKQRVAIARSLIQEPDILFADELFNNLDPKIIKDIKKLFFLKRNQCLEKEQYDFQL